MVGEKDGLRHCYMSITCTIILRQCKKKLQNTQSEEVYVHSKAWHDMNCMLMKLNWCPIDLYC